LSGLEERDHDALKVEREGEGGETREIRTDDEDKADREVALLLCRKRSSFKHTRNPSMWSLIFSLIFDGNGTHRFSQILLKKN
jgi:hypothetical protein